MNTNPKDITNFANLLHEVVTSGHQLTYPLSNTHPLMFPILQQINQAQQLLATLNDFQPLEQPTPGTTYHPLPMLQEENKDLYIFPSMWNQDNQDWTLEPSPLLNSITGEEDTPMEEAPLEEDTSMEEDTPMEEEEDTQMIEYPYQVPYKVNPTKRCAMYRIDDRVVHPKGEFKFLHKNRPMDPVRELSFSSFIYHLYHFNKPMTKPTHWNTLNNQSINKDITSTIEHIQPRNLERCMFPDESPDKYEIVLCFKYHFPSNLFKIILKNRINNTIVFRTFFKMVHAKSAPKGCRRPIQALKRGWYLDVRSNPYFYSWEWELIRYHYRMITDQQLHDINAQFRHMLQEL